MLDILENSLEEFCASAYFLLLDPSVKEHGFGILSTFVNKCRTRGMQSGAHFTRDNIENILFDHLSHMNLDLSVRQGIPSLLSAFFRYCAESGKYPPAGELESFVNDSKDRYMQRFRDNGSVKGKMFKKNYTDVNRNDPCPCGSGRKFKKCCLSIIS